MGRRAGRGSAYDLAALVNGITGGINILDARAVTTQSTQVLHLPVLPEKRPVLRCSTKAVGVRDCVC
jgi:hypothetical protein